MDKVKIIKKANNEKDIYINGTKINNVRGYDIKENISFGKSTTSLSIDIGLVDLVIESEENKQCSQKIVIPVSLDSKKLAETIATALNENQKEYASKVIQV